METLRDMAVGIAVDADSSVLIQLNREMMAARRQARGYGRDMVKAGQAYASSQQSMVKESQAFMKEANRQNAMIRQLAKTMGTSATQLAENWSDMSNEMKQSLIRNHNNLRKYHQQLMGVENDMRKLGSQMGSYTGSTNDFMNEVQRLGKQHKKISESMINNNVAMRKSIVQQVATITNMSGQSEKISKVYDGMGKSIYSVNKPLLAVTGGFERMARNGNAAVLALKQLGPNASMKELQDRINVINQGMMRYQAVALAAAAASALFYSGLHNAARDSIPGYAEAFDNMISSLRQAFQPMVEVFAMIMKPIYNFITQIANLMIAFNEAHPVIAKVVQGFLLLLPALTLILSPLAVGIGLFAGMQAAMASIWPLIGPLVTGLGAMGGTVLVVSAAIVGLGAAFYLLWTRSETFKNGVLNAWDAIKAKAQEVWGFISPYINQAISTVTSFVQSKLDQLRGFWESNGAQILQAAKNAFTPIAAVVKLAMDAIWAVMKFIWPAVLVLVKSVWGNIKGVINGALDMIMGAVKIFSGLFTGDFSKMWEGVKQLFSGAVQFIWNFIQLSFFGKILGAGKAFILSFRGLISTLWTNLRALFTNGVNFVKNFTINGFNTLSRTSNSIFTGLKNTALGIWNVLRGGLSKIVSNIITGIKSAWSSAHTNTVNMFNKIKEAVTTRFNDIVDGAKALPGRIGDGIKGMAKYAMGGIKHLANSLVAGLAQGVNGVTGGINWVFKKIGVESRIPEWKPPKYAKGTDFHPGGPAIVGDGGGPELIRTPAGQVGLSPGTSTLVNLPRGTEVLPHRETMTLMNAPAYKNGSKGDGLLHSAYNAAKNMAGQAWNGTKSLAGKIKNLALDVFDYIGNPKDLMTTIWSKIGANFPKMKGAFGQIGAGGLKWIKDKAISFVSEKMSSFMSLGDGFGGGLAFGPPFRKTSGYGQRWGQLHKGVDWAAPTGTPIPSLSSGRVARAGWGARGSGFGGYGNFVLVDSGGMSYLYAHNSKNLVKAGDTVRKGQILGLVGSTGDSTGPHVHFEVRKNGKAINPDMLGGGNFGNFKGGGAAMARAAITQALRMLGKPMSLLNPLMTIAQKESGFNPNAINNWDINARRGDPSVGLFQIIGSTFKRWMYPGHGNRRNPLHSALAAIRYMDGRYGGVINHPGIRSMMRGGGYKPYANGGIINRPHMGLVGEAGPEAIIPLSWNKRHSAFPLIKQVAARFGMSIGSSSSYSPEEAYAPSLGSAGRSAGNVTIHYEPTVNISVPGSGEVPASIKDQFEKMLEEHYRKIQSLIIEPEEVWHWHA